MTQMPSGKYYIVRYLTGLDSVYVYHDDYVLSLTLDIDYPVKPLQESYHRLFYPRIGHYLDQRSDKCFALVVIGQLNHDIDSKHMAFIKRNNERITVISGERTRVYATIKDTMAPWLKDRYAVWDGLESENE